MEGNRMGVSPEEKREEMFKTWFSPPGIPFVNPEAETLYKERVTRLIHVIQLKVPDRVPVFPSMGFFPAYYAGITPEEAMYDYDKLIMAWKKYHQDFEPDVYSGVSNPSPGRALEIMDYKLYKWPGHGTPPETPYQCIEDIYMKEDEYDALIQDPSDFWSRIYLPRIFGALAPFQKLPLLTNLVEIPNTGPYLLPYGLPEVQSAFKTLFKAGEEALKWGAAIGKANHELMGLGFPLIAGGMSKAPFDTIGDTLRGTQEIMLDMYRQPEKLIEAMEKITPLMINMGVSGAKASGNPLIFIPLHKGAEGFMSNEQFKTFYWPTLKKVILGLIDEGLIPRVFAEGSFRARLGFIEELPQGATIWKMDQTDMLEAKERIGKIACLEGNVPFSLISTGTAQEVREYCKRIIDGAGKGGGLILSTSGSIDQAKPENVRAMIAFTKEYGVYR